MTLNQEKIMQFINSNKIIKDNIKFIPISFSDKAIHSNKFKSGIESGWFVVRYHYIEWILHELAHIAAAQKKQLLVDNYGTDISDSYSYEALRHELSVFQHQSALQNGIFGNSMPNFPAYKSRSIENIKRQMTYSLKEKHLELKLHYLLPCFMEPYDFNATVRRIEFNVKRILNET